MKKTLVALTVAAFAASSASAVTVYNNEGTKVDVDGSIRLLLSNSSSKTVDANGNLKTEATKSIVPTVGTDGTVTYKQVTTNKVVNHKKGHTNLANAGSRFGVSVNHDLGDGLYALGRLELRFDEKGTTDNFGKVFVKRAFAGFGHKEFGEVKFGRQLTIGDDVGQAGFDKSFGVIPDTVITEGLSVVRYDYKGIDGLDLSVNYNFAEKRDEYGEVLVDEQKNAYEFGGVYEFNVAEGQSATVAAAYSRQNFVTGNNTKHHNDAWKIGLAYKLNSLTLALDGGQLFEKQADATAKTSFVAPGFKYQITDKNSVYGHYAYTVERDGDDKTTSHGFMLGTDYQFHKQVVGYVEGKYVRTKSGDEKSRDKAIGVGLRVFW